MSACPNCGSLNEDGRDFCDTCGAYLAWDNEPLREAPASATTAVADSVGTDAVILSLRLPDQDFGAPPNVDVEAGERTALIARVRNQSGIVDNYDLRVEGLPEDWWAVVPGTLYLLPLGTDTAYEGDVELVIHPPLSPYAEARTWPFEVVAVSRAHGDEVARAAGSVTVAPYSRIELAVRPQRVRGRRRAKLAVAVQNRGNALSDLTVSVTDADEACIFGVPQAQLALARGEGVVDVVEVRARRPIIIGRPVERRMEFTARTATVDAEPVRADATFVQRPYLPWWVGVVVPLLAAALLAYLLTRPETVRVPDLKSASTVVEAQNRLEEQGLQLDPEIERRRGARCPPGGAEGGQEEAAGDRGDGARAPRCRPGTIIAQSPAAGRRVEQGAPVAVVVAVGSRRAEVPDVVKMSAAEAESTLTAAGFPIGAADPRLDPGFVVTAQIPEAGEMRARGTPVNLFLAKPPRKRDDDEGAAGAGEKEEEEEDAAGDGAGGEKGDGEGPKVPPIKGKPLTEAAQMLHEAELVLGAVRRVISTASAGTVVASAPKAGAEAEPEQAVDVTVSAGFPRMAISDGFRLLTFDGATGARARTIAADAPSRQPAWTASGKRLAYVADNRVFLANPAKGRDGVPAPLTPDRMDAGHPSFAPTTRTRVMAFLRRTAAGGDLCFTRVSGRSASEPRCIDDDTLDLTGRPAWSVRGTEILVPGVVPGTQGARFGLVRYRSATPFSTRPSHWGSGRVVTDLSREGRGVIGAAFAPDGDRLAVITNLRWGSFRVAVTKPDDYLLEEAEVLDLPACDVAWRPDSQELAVVIGDPACVQDAGALARVDPSRPAALTAVRPFAFEPAWQPMDLEG